MSLGTNSADASPLNAAQSKQKYNFNKLQKRLRRNVGKAIGDFGMIENNDKSWCVYLAVKTATPC